MRRSIPLFFVMMLAACPSDTPPPGDVDMGGTDVAPDLTEGVSLDAIDPAEGPTEGGTEVTLSGVGFVDGMTVRFGSATAVDAEVTSDGEATATTPASTTAGAITVVIENPDGATDSLQSGFTYTGQVGPSIGFCQLQAQSPLMGGANVASNLLHAVVFAEGVTNGDGQGAGVEAELGWGADTDYESFTFGAMAYNIDIDGLEPGDSANDEYEGSVTIPDGGSYRYAARARLDGGPWTYCDLDGSDNGVADDQLGVIDIAPTGELTDACSLRYPHIVSDARTGQTFTFFGRVTKEGITGSGMQSGALQGQLFVGPAGADPTADFTVFTTVPARANPNAADPVPGEDEYVATFAPQTAGEYAFGFRFSADAGTTWTLCGLQDSISPSGTFAAVSLGAMTVADAPDVIDFCHVWQDTLTDDADTATQPVVTVEVFEDPLTVGNGGANSAEIEVEAAAIPKEVNPAWSTAVWNALAYKDLRPGEPNNYEYEGAPYTAASHPSAGDFNVVARARRVGTSTWQYCDTDEAAQRFLLDASTPLTISP